MPENVRVVVRAGGGHSEIQSTGFLEFEGPTTVLPGLRQPFIYLTGPS